MKFILIVLIGLFLVGVAMAEECKHCWHIAGVQHAVMNHIDITCCLCGKQECKHVDPSEGHGKFHPSIVTLEMQ